MLNADGSAKPRVVDDGLPLWRVRTLAHMFYGGGKAVDGGHAGAGAPANHPEAAAVVGADVSCCYYSVLIGYRRP